MANTITEAASSQSSLVNNDEHFPSLASGSKESNKGRSAWSNANLVKKIMSSSSVPSQSSDGGNHDDPFAGMNTLVSYQQEIERLKALVPKVEKKRAMLRQKSAVADLKRSRSPWSELGKTAQPSPNQGRPVSLGAPHAKMASNVEDTGPHVETAVGTLSVSSDRSSIGELSQTSSVVSDEVTPLQGLGENESMTTHVTGGSRETAEQGSVITEEEKIRFFAFMRNWTGGWQEWSKDEFYVESPMDCSLWTGASPWESKNHLWQASPTQKITEAVASPYYCATDFTLSAPYHPSNPLEHALDLNRALPLHYKHDMHMAMPLDRRHWQEQQGHLPTHMLQGIHGVGERFW